MKALVLLAASVALTIFVPILALGLCTAIVAVQGLLIVLRVAVALPDRRQSVRRPSTEPVFSIHVAIHDEPPAIVAETLDGLAGLEFPRSRYEVIVVDNNTADRRLWVPVMRHCRNLGATFRFRHEMGVRGAKAGALNIALDRTRRDATHVVTVDADYRVTPDFLRQAEEALHRTGADYVQFPQAYRRPARIARGVDMELEEYFRSQATMADGAEAVLLTGTLCVIARDALEAVGGWSGRTTTEDAELGVRLCRAGYSGRFIGRVVGLGLLPMGLPDLAAQRSRWAAGNLRTLALHAGALVARRGGLTPHRAAAVVAQLGAWLNFSLLPTGCLLAALTLGEAGSMVAAVAGASILLALADIVARLAGRGWHDRLPPLAVARAVASRIALAPAAAIATVEAMLPGRQIFVVTGKDPAMRLSTPLALVPHALLFVLAVAAIRTPSAGWSADLALLGLMLPLPAAMLTSGELARYRRHLAAPGTEVSA